MVCDDCTKKFLSDYHDASKQLRKDAEPHLSTDEAKETCDRLATSTRELVSRCILSGDPRSFIFLVEELTIILEIVGQPVAADLFRIVERILTAHYLEFGALGGYPPDESDEEIEG